MFPFRLNVVKGKTFSYLAFTETFNTQVWLPLCLREILFTPILPWINSILSWVNFVFPSDNIVLPWVEFVVPRRFLLRWQLWATVEVSFMENKIAQDVFWGWKQDLRKEDTGASSPRNLLKWRSSGIPRPSHRVAPCFLI